MTRRTGIAAALLVGAIAAILTLVVGARRQAAEPTADERAAAVLVAPASRLAAVRDLTPGVEHRYQVAVEHESELAPGQTLRVAVEGEWVVAVESVADDRVVLRAELRDARPTIEDKGAAALAGTLADALTADLARPHYLTLSASGRLLALHVAPDLQEAVRGMLGGIAAAGQLAVGASGTSWETAESDSLGDYLARYEAGAAGLRKHKVRYLRVAGAPLDAPPEAAARVVRSAGEIALRRDGWPARISGDEELAVGDVRAPATIRARWRFDHLGVRSGVAVAPPTGLDEVAIDAAASGERFRREADLELVDGASLADILAELVLVGDDPDATGYQYLRLAALFRLDDAAARAAAAEVKAGLAEREANAVIGALGEASTAAAQGELVELLGHEVLDEAARSHAAIALGLGDGPTATTLEALRQVAEDRGPIGDSAMLALGNAALRLRGDDPGGAAAEVARLLGRLAAAADDAERALVIRALGNTGDPAILPALAAALAAGSDPLRVAAVEALRLVADRRADRMLSAALGDADAAVREAAVFAASSRDLAPLVAALASVIKVDPSVEVRRAIIELAGARIEELAGLRALVAWAAEHEPDAELRASALAALAPRDGQP
jgi:hypothetical protein